MDANRKNRDQRIWILILCSILLPARLFADGAALVLSGDLSAYREAAQGFRSNFDRPFKKYLLPQSETNRKNVIEAIRSQSPKVIVAIGSKAAVEALNLLPRTPLVYCMVINPERQGLANKKNVYGISFMVKPSVLFSKYKSTLPNLRRLGLITGKTKKKSWIEEISELGKKMGIEIVVERVGSSSDIPSAMRALSGEIDAFWMTMDPVVTNKFAFNTILDFCFNSRIPLLVPVESLVSAGGLLSVTASARSMGAETAALSKDILDGRSAGSNLIQPSKVDISISLKAAKKIGIEIPDSILKISNQLP